jgi:uncharacterized protein YbaA (DUF1428 family)
MPYIEGFVAAVPTANRETYIEHAKQGAEYFKKLDTTRVNAFAIRLGSRPR